MNDEKLEPRVKTGRHTVWYAIGAGVLTAVGLAGMDIVANWDSGEWVWNAQTWDGKEGVFDIYGNLGPSEFAIPVGLTVGGVVAGILMYTNNYGRSKTTTPRTRKWTSKIEEGKPEKTWIPG